MAFPNKDKTPCEERFAFSSQGVKSIKTNPKPVFVCNSIYEDEPLPTLRSGNIYESKVHPCQLGESHQAACQSNIDDEEVSS